MGFRIGMEEPPCAVDDNTYAIINNWFGRDIAQRLLYEEADVIWLNCSKRSKFFVKNLFRGWYRLLVRPFFIFAWRKKGADDQEKAASSPN